MRWSRADGWLGAGATLTFGAALVFIALHVRSPALLDLRPAPLIGLLLTCLLCGGLALRLTRGAPLWRRALLGAPFALAALLAVGAEAYRIQLKSRVLHLPPAQLQAIARHLLVGYGEPSELKPLLRAGIAGVYVGRRNARDKTEASLAAEISGMQKLRAAAGLSPLWIATDQEGGEVAVVSPPLRRPPPLSVLAPDGDGLVAESDAVAVELACLGVNLNFAPVVDRDHRIRDPDDPSIRISQRAIAADERLIWLTARTYCGALAGRGVQCTLKHFPGIGAARGDTHAGPVSLPQLDAVELEPFREVIREMTPWIMLSHVSVASLDPGRPVSTSAPAIAVLRRDWAFNGVLVTDDAAMPAFAANFRANAVASLRNGVDMLLVSHDPDYVYVVIDAIARALRDDAPLRDAMQTSDHRLAANPPSPPVCHRMAWLARFQAK